MQAILLQKDLASQSLSLSGDLGKSQALELYQQTPQTSYE